MLEWRDRNCQPVRRQPQAGDTKEGCYQATDGVSLAGRVPVKTGHKRSQFSCAGRVVELEKPATEDAFAALRQSFWSACFSHAAASRK
jgi:hypothetical protein